MEVLIDPQNEDKKKLIDPLLDVPGRCGEGQIEFDPDRSFEEASRHSVVTFEVANHWLNGCPAAIALSLLASMACAQSFADLAWYHHIGFADLLTTFIALIDKDAVEAFSSHCANLFLLSFCGLKCTTYLRVLRVETSVSSK